jgi:hypothetical protein
MHHHLDVLKDPVFWFAMTVGIAGAVLVWLAL